MQHWLQDATKSITIYSQSKKRVGRFSLEALSLTNKTDKYIIKFIKINNFNIIQNILSDLIQSLSSNIFVYLHRLHSLKLFSTSEGNYPLFFIMTIKVMHKMTFKLRLNFNIVQNTYLRWSRSHQPLFLLIKTKTLTWKWYPLSHVAVSRIVRTWPHVNLVSIK